MINVLRGHDWTCVMNQDLPRTFPGHPALGEDGLNALRRMLTAYARHNPAVGYCQVLQWLFCLGMKLKLLTFHIPQWVLYANT